MIVGSREAQQPPAGAEPASPPGPRVEYAGPATLHGLVEAQVERTPDAIAVAFEDRAFSYRELNRWSNRIARRLLAGGAGPEAQVGVMMERSPDLVAALLGYNLGVELGQVAIVLAIAPLVLLLQRRPRAHHAVTRALAAAIFAAGMYWFVERLAG